MSSTYCHRCKRLMALSLVICPHCGTPQDEASRAESGRRDRITWCTVGAGALIGLAGGWIFGGASESLPLWLIIGVLLGRSAVAVRFGR